MANFDVQTLTRDSDWSDLRVCVVGLGIAGFACADALIQLNAKVVVLDANPGEKQKERAT